MRILLLSFYYPPDIGPGPLRAESIVNALLEHPDVEIDVLTTQPNRYQAIAKSTDGQVSSDTLRITRFQLSAHQSGMRDQAVAFTHFAKGVLSAVRGKEWDIVVATSSRLMTAALGALVARRVDGKLYLDIRDLFTDTMKDVLFGSKLRYLMPLFHWIEKKTLLAADQVNVISPGFLPYLQKFQLCHQPSSYTNGIDEEFMRFDFHSFSSDGNTTVLYAGNIGEGQGLHRVLPDVAAKFQDSVHFCVIGDGGKRMELENAVKQNGLSNVEFVVPMPRAELFQYYTESDVLFLHLNDYAAFKKVLPSKIFEYAATGKPILAGVSGYSADFLRTEVDGAFIFDPCNAEQMGECLEQIRIGTTEYPRSNFVSNYSRNQIVQKMAVDIVSLARVS